MSPRDLLCQGMTGTEIREQTFRGMARSCEAVPLRTLEPILHTEQPRDEKLTRPPPYKSGHIISSTVTRADTTKKRLHRTVKAAHAKIVKKFVEIFGSSSGKCQTQTIDGRPQVQSKSINMLPKV